MGALSFREETKYLRGFAKWYFSETTLEAEAEVFMRQHGIDLSDIQHALRRGVVTVSEKEDAYATAWIVEGQTTEDVHLRLWLEVYCNEYRVRVVRIRIIEESAND